jgi:glycosyltransferase involved in cell wall biosynthesis
MAESAAVYARPNDPIDLADKLHDLLGDEGRRASMGQFGRKRVFDTLSWDISKRSLVSAYEALADE